MTASVNQTLHTAPASSGGGCSRDVMLRGMRCLDTSHNTNVPVLMEMVGALSRTTEAREVLRIFGEGWNQIHGPRGYISLSTRGLEPGQYRITRLMTDLDEEHLQDVDSWSKPDAFDIHEGGFLGEIIRSAYPEVIYDLHLANDPVLGDAIAQYRSMMAVPLFDNGEPLNWAVMFSLEPEGYSIRDLEETILRGNLIGGTVKNKLLTKQLNDANLRAQREVDQIAAIQRALLPDPLPAISNLEIAASYETYDLAGGDYYDFVPMQFLADGTPDPDGLWGVLIADASGHGPAAAVVMAMLHAILHAHPSGPHGAAEVLEHTNRNLSAKRIESSFVTAFFAVYDPKQRTLTYARAGHNPPLLKSPGSGGTVSRLDDIGGIPLGILDDVSYEESTVTLQPGQTVVLYTDGITEATDPDGEMFGLDGIERALTACTGYPECVHGSLSTALRAHEAGVRPVDDQTFVAFRVGPWDDDAVG